MVLFNELGTVYVKVLLTELILSIPILVLYDILPDKYKKFCGITFLMFVIIAVAGFCGLAIYKVWTLNM